MVLATHVIFSAYGFWLPNDPRGSWSDFVAAWELVLAAGPATKVDTHESVAAVEHDRTARIAAKGALQYPAVEFDGVQARAVARGFAKAVDESAYRVFACSILPAHVHLVIERHAHRARQIAGHLKTRATQLLARDGLHPLSGFEKPRGGPPSPWGEKCWDVFLNWPADVRRAVEYVEQNPVKEGKKPQRWSFVTAFEQ